MFASKTIQIIPKPLFINKDSNGNCPRGYELSQDGNYCVRDDIRRLSCVVTGCPTINNQPYIFQLEGVRVFLVFLYIEYLH